MLEAKTLTIKKSTNSSGKIVKFIPEMVEDKEVYSVVNKNNEHCGYITEDLFNLLLEQDPEEKENKALFHRALGVDDEEKEEETLIFGKKIILDVSSTKDINDFEKIILAPVTYTKGAKPLTIKIGTFFCIQNQGKLLDINVKSDFIECDNFLVSNLTSTTLNIDLNNKSPYFGGIHLYGIENFQNPGGEINLHFFTRNCGFFELFDSTFNNGKKSILFQRGNNYFDNTTIENDGKSNLAFSNVNIKNSNLTNVSNLNNCNISNSEVFNFNLVPATSPKSKQVFSFGPTKEYPKSGFFNPGDRGILCSLKNTVVELDGANFFIDNTKGALHLNNSIIKGATLIETTKDEGSYSLSIDNSVLDNARISLVENGKENREVMTTISNSEIKRQLNANKLKSIKNSVIDNSHFDQVSEINDSICESASLEGKSSNILNGYGYTSTPNDGQKNTKVGQANNDLEIL